MAAYISFQPSDYYNTKLYTGTGSSHAITGVGFQPDATWIKGRTTTYAHVLTDSVRGVTKEIYPNASSGEVTNVNGLTAFGADGFTVGSDAGYNGSTNTMVSWNWKANGAGSTNEVGDITSTVSINTTSKFSIVKYPANGSESQTVGHGLGVVPKMIIVKKLGGGSTRGWAVYHHSLGNTKGLAFNTSAVATKPQWWGNTTPTTTVFTIGSDGEVNDTGTDYIAYCFADVKGYSAFKAYRGNNNVEGPFIFTGFRPAFIMCKYTDSTGNWMMYDDKRDGYNEANDRLIANTTGVEASSAIDILSNGFKVRSTDTYLNVSGGNYIYAAFAESPIVSSNDIPGLAR